MKHYIDTSFFWGDSYCGKSVSKSGTLIQLADIRFPFLTLFPKLWASLMSGYLSKILSIEPNKYSCGLHHWLHKIKY